MEIRNVYTSAACNQTTESLDWAAAPHNLIIYAATNAVVVYDPQRRRVLRTISSHTTRVNTVKWVAASSNRTSVSFVTGSDDNRCIVHRIENVDGDGNEAEANAAVVVARLSGHTGGVKIVDTAPLGGDGSQLLVATGSSDGTLKLWLCSLDAVDVAVECFQTIDFRSVLCLAVRLLVVGDAIWLAVGAGDQIHVYRTSSEDLKQPSPFRLLQTLTGHEDWVRGLDFVVASPSTNTTNDVSSAVEILLASSSQDSFIRLWKCVDPVAGRLALESVLAGHENWVYSVQWTRTDGDQRLQLLSSSMDKSMILWQQDWDDGGIWRETVRFGDIGGHFLGFFGARMSPGGRALLGHGHHGSFHLWQMAEDGGGADAGRWRPGRLAIGGHAGEARDVVWDRRGRYLLSVSADQTTRLHAPTRWDDGAGDDDVWHELARPQIHGYDMQTIAVLGAYRFASGAEEKIVRTFQAPSGFVQSLRAVCGGDYADDEGDAILSSKSKSATLPTLGLSNQACDGELSAVDVEASDDADDIEADISSEPPTEETLMQNTLWPETQKLYGHGYEVFSLCASSDGALLASACKANSAEHAQIILWNTNTWKQHQQLAAHQLTITQMRFSPDDRYLLSVSRDRRWAVFERSPETADYALLEASNKTTGIHARIIWTCDWSPDSRYFATGSRDGKLVAWHRNSEGDATQQQQQQHFTAVDVLDIVGESITALAFALRSTADRYLVAIGTDSGRIQLVRFSERQWRSIVVLSQSQAHHGTVRKLAFRPTRPVDDGKDDDGQHQLASCGNDHFVRIFAISE